jgi:hypothetical protein
MAAGAAYVFSESLRERLRLKLRSLTREQRRKEEHRLQIELDRILEKVHQQGLHSLTLNEKRTLKKATKAEQKRCGL